jgi:hypothetical protein
MKSLLCVITLSLLMSQIITTGRKNEFNLPSGKEGKSTSTETASNSGAAKAESHESGNETEAHKGNHSTSYSGKHNASRN